MPFLTLTLPSRRIFPLLFARNGQEETQSTYFTSGWKIEGGENKRKRKSQIQDRFFLLYRDGPRINKNNYDSISFIRRLSWWNGCKKKSDYLCSFFYWIQSLRWKHVAKGIKYYECMFCKGMFFDLSCHFRTPSILFSNDFFKITC